jgi:uncharacterized protein (DUF1810 family)
MADPFQLDRFVAAQDDGVYDHAVEELRRGLKSGHWMWFVFPQIAGLGHSSYAQLYGISSLDEARAYLHHPVLGPRLRECAQLLLAIDGKTATDVFGHTDAMKLRSSMTLFAAASADDDTYQHVLDKYFGGAADRLTTDRLAARG